MKKKNVMICLSEEAITKAKEMAKREKRSMSGLIEWLIMITKIIFLFLFVSSCKQHAPKMKLNENMREINMNYPLLFDIINSKTGEIYRKDFIGNNGQFTVKSGQENILIGKESGINMNPKHKINFWYDADIIFEKK